MIEDFFKPLTLKSLKDTNDLNDEYENDEQFIESTINGYIGSRSPMEQYTGGKWTTKIQYKFFSDTQVFHGDIIVDNGNNYRVISDPQNTINIDHHYKSFVEQLTNIT